MSVKTEVKCGLDIKIFVTEPPNSCLCAICLNVLNDPRQCPSGHCYCLGCISKSLTVRKVCPLCDVGLTVATLGKNLFVKGVVDEMLTICESNQSPDFNPSDCCAWTGPLHKRDAHYAQDCQYLRSQCLNVNCSELTERRKLTEHFLNCPFRLSACVLCDEAVPFKDNDAHKTTCVYRLVCCGNNCGIVLPFNELKAHVLKDCVLQPVECPLFRLGNCNNCKGSVPRNEITEHIVGAENLSSTVVTLVTKVDSLSEENKTLVGKLDNMAAKLHEMDMRMAARNQLRDLEFTFTQILSTSKEKVFFPVFAFHNVCGILRDWVRNDSNGDCFDPAVARIDKQLNLQRRPLVTLHAAFEISGEELQEMKLNETLKKETIENSSMNFGRIPNVSRGFVSVTRKNSTFEITCTLAASIPYRSEIPLNKTFSYVCTFCVFNQTTTQPCSSESTVMSDKMYFEFDTPTLFNYKLKMLMTYFYDDKV